MRQDTSPALSKKLNSSDPEKSIGKEAALELATIIHTSTAALPSNLPASLRSHTFDLLHNAVPTRMRVRHFAGSHTRCALCNRLHESLAHLHTECRASTQAVSIIMDQSPDKSSLSILRSASPDDVRMHTSRMQEATSVYTDGSSLGNPGPAGSGFWISVPAKSNKALISTLLSALDKLSEIATPKFFWFPGHANIPGNEIADWLAKRGGRRISTAPSSTLNDLRLGRTSAPEVPAD